MINDQAAPLNPAAAAQELRVGQFHPFALLQSVVTVAQIWTFTHICGENMLQTGIKYPQRADNDLQNR